MSNRSQEGRPMAKRPVLVVEDDAFTRLIPIILDPESSAERRVAFADFMSPDEPDFDGWLARVRAGAPGLYPAEVRMVSSQSEMRAQLGDCQVLVVESLSVGGDDLAGAGQLRVVQKFGALLRNIDVAACQAKNVKVLTLRRRANISCAEHVFALMLGLARRLEAVSGRVTVERIAAAGEALRPFDRHHTPGGNFARISGTRALNEATIGIIGLGEIGREVASRAVAFGMHVLYHQRTRLAEAEEHMLGVHFVPLDTLLAGADWVVPQVPVSPATTGLLGRAQFARMKPGARLINVAGAALIDRDALLDALRSGHLGGAALDVYYQEPLAEGDPILGFDNVIITPHMAGSPRFNGLNDFEQLVTGLARELPT
jgi:phosphoglycerate dehydrogenase-like enzyme